MNETLTVQELRKSYEYKDAIAMGIKIFIAEDAMWIYISLKMGDFTSPISEFPQGSIVQILAISLYRKVIEFDKLTKKYKK